MPANPTIERVSQSAIQIPAAVPEPAFREVRGILLRWLANKVRHDLPPDMARGGTDVVDRIGSPRTETASLDDPVFWSFRNDDPDKEHPQRTWVTEASLALEPNGLILGYRLHAANRGEPAPFERSVPRFVRDVGATYRARIEGIEASLQATPVDVDDINALIDLLDDSRRAVPVVGISVVRDYHRDAPALDAQVLAARVFGAAHVRLLTWAASFALTDRLGKPLSVFGGAVRIWRAGDRVRGSDPYTHPLVFPDRKPTPGDAVKSVAETVLRESAMRRDADRLVPSFATVRGLVAGLALRRARDDAPQSETLKLYEDDNKRLSREIAETKAECDALLHIADEERAAIESERDAAREEIASLNARLAFLDLRFRENDPFRSVQVPNDFDELERWAGCLGDSVVLLPRAIRAAQNSLLERPALAYHALLLMRDAYGPMRRGLAGARQLWDDGLQKYGLRDEPAFAGAGAGQFGDEYFVPWDGRRRKLDRHLKKSNSRDPRYVFRLYFFWCDSTCRVVVGSLPSHLTTGIT